MKSGMNPLISALDLGFLVLAWVAAAFGALMMCVTFADVVMRYLFRSPIPGSFEITEISMGLIVFFALPQMVRSRGNICVTVLFDRFSPPVRRYATFATELLGAAISVFIAWRMWLYGARILRYGEITMELRIPKGLIAQSMALLLIVTALAFILSARDALRGETGARPVGPGL
ncbi:TRAP transporter small permease [Pikeienuella sp. HZG-20]|uniref:TRAP transporter small permease n=1 Tax=Paludibacillus litoralis TaxID=3133267 RepID=UPI0030EB95A3